MVKLSDIEDDVINDFMNSSEGYDFWADTYSGEIMLTKDNYLDWCENGEVTIEDVPYDYFDKWLDEYFEKIRHKKITNWREEMENV